MFSMLPVEIVEQGDGVTALKKALGK